MSKNKEEYEFIYDNGDDSGIDYSDLSENEDPDEVIARLEESLGRGPCPQCNNITMVPDDKGVCYFCTECGYAEHKELYLRGLAGYSIE